MKRRTIGLILTLALLLGIFPAFSLPAAATADATVTITSLESVSAIQSAIQGVFNFTDTIISAVGGGQHNRAINLRAFEGNTPRTVTMSGGSLFSPRPTSEATPDNVVSAPNTATINYINNATIIAWNRTENRAFNQGSSTNLSVSAGTAVWDIANGINGISYSNSSNSGFIPVPGVSVTSAGTSRTLTFTPNTESREYGSSTFTRTPTISAGSGTVTYVISDTDAATVDSGSGLVLSRALGHPPSPRQWVPAGATRKQAAAIH